jgi:hypothetical protein
MYIQYLGFETGTNSRIYAFHVIDVPNAARDFTVTVQSEAFRPDGLKLQDGPGICFARLGHELRGQTQDSRPERDLIIGERDIKEYLGQQHPQKAQGKKEVI